MPRTYFDHANAKQTPEECTHLIDLAKPSMIKSTVVDSATGKSKDSRFVLWCFILWNSTLSILYTLKFVFLSSQVWPDNLKSLEMQGTHKLRDIFDKRTRQNHPNN